MKVRALIILLICFFSYSPLVQSQVTKEESAIYAIILKDIQTGDWRENKAKSPFVIVAETYKPEDNGDWFVDNIRGLSASFEKKNQTSVTLENLSPTKQEYQIIKKSEIDKLLEVGRKEFDDNQKKLIENNKRIVPNYSEQIWKYFYEKYPDSNGYYEFTRIGFSPGGEFALAYVEQRASSNGRWTGYLFRKVKGRWKIHFASRNGWIS